MNVAFDPKLIDHLELREKALKERDARALYQMAQIYASMKGKKNEKKAYELYKSSATHGYAKARFMMGLCNEKGIGVKQSLPMAITWYIRAEISAASDIADRSDTADEMDRERLHIFREEPGFATELDDAAYARPDVLESVTIEEIAFAAEQGSGKIKFKGVVIDAPCSIAPDSVDKEVDLGEVTTAVINANKKSSAVPVDINLENCQLDDPADETDTPVTKVDVTFTSSATDATDTSLMTNTYASGAQNVGVRLLNNAEANITLGAANEVALLAGSTTQTLHFKALMEVVTGKTATAGQVEATANYILAYK